MSKVIITPEDLATSARKYRSELIMQPVHALADTLKHMNLRTGIRYSETVGELSADLEMGPYSESRVDDEDVAIKGRTLYTYLGSVVKNFSPNSVASSLYGSAITKGEALKTTEITKQVLAVLSAKIGQGLDMHIFDAVRNENGSGSADLFDGFDTITGKEIKAGEIATAKGNLFEFGEKIDKNNAVDSIVSFCRTADPLLVGRNKNLKLFLPINVLNAYNDDYKATTGAVPYNTQFEQQYVEGFRNIEMVPMYQKAGSEYLHLTTANNMLVGVNLQGEEERIEVEKHHPFLLSFIATMFFGVEFESIAKERMLVGKLINA